MKRMQRLLLSLTAFAVLFSFCQLSVAGSQDKAKYKYFWKYATLAPDGMGWSKHMKDVIFPVMNSFTRGELYVKTYWGGVMGDEEDYIRKIRIGQLQGAGLSAQGTVMVCPEMSVLEMPFLFRDYYEVDYIRVKMDRVFDEVFNRQKIFLVGWIDQDFDQVYSSKYPMETLADFSKSRFLTWYGTMEQEMLKTLGADAVPINVPEAATAFRQGMGDAAIAPGIMIIATQLQSRFRYVNTMKIRYSPATIIQTMASLNELPAEYRKDFYVQRLELGWRYSNLVRKDNEKYLQALINYGIRPAKMTPQALEEIKAKVKGINHKVVGALFSQKLLDTLNGHLADFRSGRRLTRADLIEFARLDPSKITPQELKGIEDRIRKGLKEFGYAEGSLVKLD